MTPAIPEALLSDLSDTVAARMGLHFPQDRRHDLARGAAAAARELGFETAEAYIRSLLAAPLADGYIEALARHLTVGETYFFRDSQSFAALEDCVIPERLGRRQTGEKRIRIWCAGCCTGEEPYSIAMLLDRVAPEAAVTLLATDINKAFLAKAAQGLYGEWSFRATPNWLRARYFKQTADGRFQIDPDIRRKVVFAHLNLAQDDYPSPLNGTQDVDIIFCRNVLMYFSPECGRAMVAKLHRCLADGGWLFVSPSEASQTLFAEFTTVTRPGLILYRKAPCGGPERALPPAPRESPSPPAGDEGYSEARAAPPAVRPDAVPPAPSDAVGPAERARAASGRGRSAEGVERLGAARGDDVNAEALLSLARALANQGRLAEAQACSEKAVALDKLDPAAHYLLGVILQERNQEERAVASIRRTLYLDPDFVPAHVALGNLLWGRGRVREAEKHLRRALAVLEKYPPADPVPESEGVTAGQLMELIRSTLQQAVPS